MTEPKCDVWLFEIELGEEPGGAGVRREELDDREGVVIDAEYGQRAVEEELDGLFVGDELHWCLLEGRP
jgi:hypothetical protein